MLISQLEGQGQGTPSVQAVAARGPVTDGAVERDGWDWRLFLEASYCFISSLHTCDK